MYFIFDCKILTFCLTVVTTALQNHIFLLYILMERILVILDCTSMQCSICLIIKFKKHIKVANFCKCAFTNGNSDAYIRTEGRNHIIQTCIKHQYVSHVNHQRLARVLMGERNLLERFLSSFRHKRNFSWFPTSLYETCGDTKPDFSDQY